MAPQAPNLHITSPVAGDLIRGEAVAVSGNLTLLDGDWSAVTIDGVWVQLGEGGPATPAVLLPTSGNQRQWRHPGTLPAGLPPGAQPTITATVTGAIAATPFTMSTAVTIVYLPADMTTLPELRMAPVSYLEQLIGTVASYIEVDGFPGAAGPAFLTGLLKQPYDRLTRFLAHDAASAPVQRARIAVEVLRAALEEPAPAEIDQLGRAAAYQALLAELGTSYDELRAVRHAAPEVRRSLADALGLTASEERPDQLDALTVSPSSVTDAQLTTLFGYRAADPFDPLPAEPLPASQVVQFRRTALVSGWRIADEELRDGPDGAAPLIDPDLIGAAYLRDQSPGGPAYQLWHSRREWVAARLAEIQDRIDAEGGALAGFDTAVEVFVGQLSLPDLAAQDADGVDISNQLKPLDLGLAAFRFLARMRAALAGGAQLDSDDWQDVAAVLLQVTKLRQFSQWRSDERAHGVVLEPATFVLAADDHADPPRWRGDRRTLADWRATLAARTQQDQAVEARWGAAVHAAEAQALPELRTALVAELGGRHQPPETPDQAAGRLARELCLDLAADGPTTRIDHAIGTLQNLLVSVRSGVPPATGPVLTINDEVAFDRVWEWVASYQRWRSAAMSFAYPDNQVQPHLFRPEQVPSGPQLAPTQAFQAFVASLNTIKRMDTVTARAAAVEFLAALQAEVGPGPAPGSALPTDQTTRDQLRSRRLLCQALSGGATTTEAQIPQPVRELFLLVPLALAAKLRDSHEHRAALGWYEIVFAYQMKPGEREIYRGLTLEADTTSDYAEPVAWLSVPGELNPHITARKRRRAYTRFIVMSLAESLTGYADAEFAQNTEEANARARALYQSTMDVLALPEVVEPTTPAYPFLPNPVWTALRSAAAAGLAKINAGLNIAGYVEPAAAPADNVLLPSQYRFSAIMERAKNAVAIAQQVESTYLSVLERVDAETYSVLQAGRDLQVTDSAVAVHDLKVVDAQIGVDVALTQQAKSRDLVDTLQDRLDNGLSDFERSQLDSLSAARLWQALGTYFSGVGGLVTSIATLGIGAGSAAGQFASQQAQLGSIDAQVSGLKAGYQRRAEEWQLQKGQATFDVEIGAKQVLTARNQQALAVRERAIAVLNRDHAQAVVAFISTKFTNADLYQWMSGVLGRVYAYFLQQATSLARLAQAQLAFERQEPIIGFVAADYWDDPRSDPATDRRGLTGSARLLQDLHRLDGHAFETDRRRLQLSQTLSLAELAGFELQQFRQTGVLTFALPEEQFDREFPGHYLRLVKRVKVSMIALLPPVRGVRATLTAAGVSRTVVARGPFKTVTLHRDPETIAFTTPVSATGTFELVPDDGMLQPFEGMGVDSVWQLVMPKAANPFDYHTIADVLVTVDYTAVHSDDYRQTVIRRLDRRFSADRSFSIRSQFPDAWYELCNPDTVEQPTARMKALLALTPDDFPPHVENLDTGELALIVLHKDADSSDELTITSLTRTANGVSKSAGPVTTAGRIVSTRRSSGAAWRDLTGSDPRASWEIQLPDTPQTRSWFTDGTIEDIVLVMSLRGTTPRWR